MLDIARRIAKMCAAPSEPKAFDAWLESHDALELLRKNKSQTDLIVYASIAGHVIQAVVVPRASVIPPDINDLTTWDWGSNSSWTMSYTFTNPSEIKIIPPLSEARTQFLRSGEQLIFTRTFSGRLDGKFYFEALQKFTHIFNLHFLHDRNAYCKIDEHGDIDEVIKFHRIPASDSDNAGWLATFRREQVEEYMAITDSVVVQMFDFARTRKDGFSSWSNKTSEKNVTEENLFYRSKIEPGNGSYFRGAQIIQPKLSKTDVVNKHQRAWSDEGKQYASFIAHDWKNGSVKEISCAPEATANYFTKSDLPFELSPAFFNPEVLSKYKSDSDKYALDERSISCRDTWYLQSYDINDAGQVHAYLVDLRRLPLREQLHWKSYNEPPKGPISARAFKTDFEGTWDDFHNPLRSLKSFMQSSSVKNSWCWKLRSEHLLDRVHYPATTSADEWSTEILHFDQLINEGFEEKPLRKAAQDAGRRPPEGFRSIKLVSECLLASGVDEIEAAKIIEPLQELRHLRTKLKGHAAGGDATILRQNALKKFGTYRKHFENLSSRCCESFQTILKVVGKVPDTKEPE